MWIQNSSIINFNINPIIRRSRRLWRCRNTINYNQTHKTRTKTNRWANANAENSIINLILLFGASPPKCGRREIGHIRFFGFVFCRFLKYILIEATAVTLVGYFNDTKVTIKMVFVSLMLIWINQQSTRAESNEINK